MDATTYEIVLSAHSILRWVVTGLLALLVLRGLWGTVTGSERGAIAKLLGLASVIALDVQVLLGLSLHLVLSPLTKAAFADMKATMSNSVSRFWTVEHGAMMVLAAIVFHSSRIWSRKARSDRSEDFRVLLGAAIALALIVAASPWPFRDAGIWRGDWYFLPGSRH